jgi:CDP-paratose 2-epimerase
MGGALITGGAGFLGSNLAIYLSGKLDSVTVLDNFSRVGSEKNAEWLEKNGIKVIKADVKKENVFNADDYGYIFHLAGQVTVTESVKNPKVDFFENALGTLQVLETVRLSLKKPVVLYSSTNKVYGDIGSITMVDEKQPLSFLSPYGCSKGTADQYVLDYAHTFGLSTVVLRNSCIYGERQFGIEGQGWIAWFASRLLSGKPLTIFGDGRQVRDILHVDDWVEVALRAADNASKGSVFNIGGGKNNSISLLDAVRLISKIANVKAILSFEDPRVSDQQYYVSDITKAKAELNWSPVISTEEGIRRLIEWTKQII